MSIHDPLNDLFTKAVPLELDITLSGDTLNVTIEAPTFELEITLSATAPAADMKIDAPSITSDLSFGADVDTHRNRINWVGWSKIGEASFELDLTNEAGFRPMAWDGYCLAVKQLGKNVIAYGTNGVTLLYPVSAPSATFGFRDLLRRVGIKSKNALCGDANVHYFIDRLGQLWKVSGEGEVENLDYSEFLDGLSNPLMHYDYHLNRVLISDADTGYVLTNAGLGGGYANLTGYVRAFGEVFITSPGTPTRSKPYYITSTLDFGQRGTKTLTGIQLSTNTPEKFELAYDSRFSQGQDWRASKWIPFNRWGWASLRIAALEFRVKIRAIDQVANGDLDAMIDYMIMSVQFSDNRFKRGASTSGRPDSQEIGVG
jgi:hypothetical protein